MGDIGMDSDYRSGEPEEEYDPIWDNERLSALHYGGGSLRTCHHGYYRGECPSCHPDRPERVTDEADW